MIKFCLAAASSSQRLKPMNCLCFAGQLKLVPDPQSYNFLNSSGCTKVDTIDDHATFQAVQVCTLTSWKGHQMWDEISLLLLTVCL